MTRKTRREALRNAAGLTALPILAQHVHEQPGNPKPKAPQPPPYRPAVLNAAEYALLSVLVDLIIPRTDTPGATDAKVPEYIDRLLAANTRMATRLRSGFAQTEKLARSRHNSAFGKLDNKQQVALLEQMSKESHEFFRALKNLTIDGYYGSREGLTVELGWNANIALADFPGCTHPEHKS